MENRRDFFKAVGLFAAGVVGAKIASYTPKKKEEELQVAESVIVKDNDGNEYNMVVVPKKEEPKQVTTLVSRSVWVENVRADGTRWGGGSIMTSNQPEALMTINQSKKLRKLNA